MTDNTAFVRHDTIPPSPPPASEVGIVGWFRANLFSSIGNSVLTFLALIGIVLLSVF